MQILSFIKQIHLLKIYKNDTSHLLKPPDKFVEKVKKKIKLNNLYRIF